MTVEGFSNLHKATDIVPKFTGSLSLLGSYVIQRELWSDFTNKDNRRSSAACTVLNRTLFALCVADYLLTLSNMLTSLPIPHDEENVKVWGNFGTRATCTAQGFAFSFGLWTSSVLNLHVACVAYLIVCHGWSERRLRKIEPYIHLSTWIPALVTASLPVHLELYNPAPHICWLHSYPFGCKESRRFGKEEADCVRGDNGSIYNLVYVIFPMWFCIFASATMFVLIYRRVRRLEHERSQASFHVSISNLESNNNITAGTNTATASAAAPPARIVPLPQNSARSKLVAWRAIWLILSFLATYTLSLVRSLYWLCFSGFNEWLAFWNLTVYVIQGIFNLLAFMKTRQQMQTPEGRLMRYLLFLQWLPHSQGPQVSSSSKEEEDEQTNGHCPGTTSSNGNEPSQSINQY